MKRRQKYVSKKMQEKLSYFLDSFRGAITFPELKFLTDMLLGIIISKSVICMRIAGALNQDLDSKKITQRFTRHLNKEGFEECLTSLIIKKQCSYFNRYTPIIVDESDIVKKKAKNMEGLQYLRDGSTGETNKLGYHLLNLITVDKSANDYEIKPISSDIISTDIDEDGIFITLEKRMIEIDLAGGNQGIYIFDRGFDRRNLLDFVHLHEMSYIIRSCGDRNLILDSAEEKFSDVVKKVELKYHTKIKDDRVSCGAIKVKVRMNKHPVKHPDTIETWLVVAKYDNNVHEDGGYFYLLCSFFREPDLSIEEICKKAIDMYGLRWTIEQYHRHVKQEYGWEDIQLTSYKRLRNLNKLLLLAMCFLYSLNVLRVSFVEAYPSIMQYKKGEALETTFIFYRISKALSECARLISILLLKKLPKKRKDPYQLLLPGF